VSDYAAFLESKRQLGGRHGFDPIEVPETLFPFQRDLVTWALQMGRAAIFADCGLGKTPMQLVWADNVVRHTSGRVLIVTPLAVSHQTVREGAKFGIPVTRSDDGTPRGDITVTNYERLDRFNPADFEGTVCDESSAIKAFNGERRKVVTEFMRRQKYRLLCTATAAPNDYIELGTSSEALGQLGHMDMLGRFFKHVDNIGISHHDRFRFKHNEKKAWMAESGSLWRFKGHAEDDFWRWVASWARALRRPSDMGHDDDGFLLPPLTEREHLVEAHRPADGMLFEVPAIGLREQREEQRRTLHERCERAAQLVNDTGQPAVVWCHLNDEGKLLARLIPDAVEVAGSDTDDHKERSFMAFADGGIRVLVSKPKIGAWGLNWQHCAHETFFPSHSYEAYYQAVRRCWRYGQKRPVTVDLVTTKGGHDVMANLQRKATAADRMFTRLVAHMNDALAIDAGRTFDKREEVPSWLLQTSA